ncbi:MAG: hypothetical protein RLZZ262_1982 [Bacteroidota bacterium]
MNNTPSRSRLFFDGFGSVMRAFQFVADNRLWPYYLVPLIIDFVLSASLFVLIHGWSQELTQIICGWLGIDMATDLNTAGLWEWIKLASSYIIRFLVYVAITLCYWSIRKNLIVALSSPIMSLLSDRTEEILSGQKTPFDGPQFVRDLVRSGLLALRNFFIECGVSIGIFLLSFLVSLIGGPLALIAVPVLSLSGLAVSSYYFGGSLIDYSLERRKLSIRETLDFNRRNKMSVIGIGAAFHVLLLIPFIGIALAIVLGTTGATQWMVKEKSTHK